MQFKSAAARSRPSLVAMLVMASLMICTPRLAAQTSLDKAQDPDCTTAKSSQSTTPVNKGSSSGAKNMGSTGWSGGGLGGSYNGTSHDGASGRSRTIQPELARGLDPTKSQPRRTASTDECADRK